MKIQASAGAGLALLCAVSASLAQAAGGFTVAAFAADVQAVVLRDGEGHLARYAVGQVLPGGGWKVMAVHPADVELRSLASVAGHAVSARLHRGDAVDNDAIGRLRATPGQGPSTHP